MNSQVAIKQSYLNNAASDLSPDQIRNLAESLLRLADCIDQDWQGPEIKSIFRWPNELSKIEKNALNLAEKARQTYERRRLRNKSLPSSLLGEPAWDMLLELFMQYAGGAKVSTTSLCIASGCPPTTALRYVGLMENEGLLKRTPAETDKRLVFVELTDAGVIAIGRYLERL
ncbi:hypothetical protein CP97_14710 [Aurantiacibacter atlanticus]|uniref:Uncharacterized protein n=1 Tax=Aurantiacibacter atlanticus TaxID=1648404 RepID=A0A168M193_9SPHN|nr:MarR family winged helix-turn-helix transcriptional regulator [Aurantiacibacter atlanticus]ANC50396.1 hypothetical protein CP97_14710 [Aurantiacibacter atlanticus]MDF1835690.1 MarR family winged helix-turn-helix transcriptional regulator [Alteraurantiacibacter sp. bin_em_oilr2.035]